MFRALTVCASALLALAAVAGAQENVALPKGPPPQFRLVSKVDRAGNSITLREQVVVPVTEEQKVKVAVVVGGKVVEEDRTVPVTRHVPQQRETLHVLGKGVYVTDVAGKKLGHEEALQKVAAGKMILISSDEDGIDPAYRALLAKDALVLVVPFTAQPAPVRVPPPEK